jgi:HEPN domain-containing protein
MNRTDLQRLSNARIREAKVLLKASEFSGAYYLAGYAIECALKACFAKAVRRHDFPDRISSRKVFTHSLVELIDLAFLKAELDKEMKANLKLEASWNEVRRWTEESRYAIWSRDQAETLIRAIERRRDGVLPWIKQRW